MLYLSPPPSPQPAVAELGPMLGGSGVDVFLLSMKAGGRSVHSRAGASNLGGCTRNRHQGMTWWWAALLEQQHPGHVLRTHAGAKKHEKQYSRCEFKCCFC